jgi:hypothetical protein
MSFESFSILALLYPPRMEFVFLGSVVCRRLPSDSALDLLCEPARCFGRRVCERFSLDTLALS